MNRFAKPLLAAIVVLLVVGIGLAVVQPGDLGGDDESALQGDRGEPADGGDADRTTSTTRPDGATSSTTPATGGAPGGEDGSTSTTTAPSTTAAPTTTEAPDVSDGATGGDEGSGLGSSGAPEPSDTSDGLADTGGGSLALLGLALGAVGLAARRRVARR